MSDDFRLLMIGAMYENGGNTTHRFLDGHPQLFVYPFESQLGTRLVTDELTSMFPVKYRWPMFALDATPARGLPRDHRRGGQGPRAHAAREQVPPHAVRLLRRRAARALRRPRAATRPLARRATWRPSSARRSTPGRTTSAAGAKGLRRLQPDHHRRRREDPRRSARAPTCCTSCAIPGRPTPTPRSAPCRSRSRDYMLRLDPEPAPRAPVRERHSRSRPHRAHRGRHGRPDSHPGRALSRASASSPRPDRCARPSWNGKELEEVYPWGTIRARRRRPTGPRRSSCRRKSAGPSGRPPPIIWKGSATPTTSEARPASTDAGRDRLGIETARFAQKCR